MKKVFILPFASLLLIACSSNQNKHEYFTEAAMACSNVCENHPEISELSSSGGIGSPLLFIGGIETSCKCSR